MELLPTQCNFDAAVWECIMKWYVAGYTRQENQPSRPKAKKTKMEMPTNRTSYIDLRRENFTNIMLVSKILRWALFRQFSSITEVTFGLTEHTVFTGNFLLNPAFLLTLIRGGVIRLREISFVEKSFMNGSNEFSEDVVPSSERFFGSENSLQSLLRFFITSDTARIRDVDAFLESAAAVSMPPLDRIGVVFTSPLLWFTKWCRSTTQLSNSRKRAAESRIVSSLCTSKFYRLLNFDAREVQMNLAMLEEEEFICFIELLWSEHQTPTSQPRIGAPSTTSFHLIDEFSLSPSDLRIPVREYGRLLEIALTHLPNLDKLHFTIDCLYRSGPRTPPQAMHSHLVKICNLNAEIVELVAEVLERMGRNGVVECKVEYILRANRIRNFAQELINQHKLFRMGKVLEKEVEKASMPGHNKSLAIRTKPKPALEYHMEFQFDD